jgi:hypothetical protein
MNAKAAKLADSNPAFMIPPNELNHPTTPSH